jgi:hypothetical protein
MAGVSHPHIWSDGVIPAKAEGPPANGSARGQAGAGTAGRTDNNSHCTPSPAQAQPQPACQFEERIASRPFAVVIDGARRREWGHYSMLLEAETTATKLRAHGFDASVEVRDA